MTERERDCLDFCRRFIAENGHSPSFAEIGTALGGLVRSNVSRLVNSLLAQGYLRSTKSCGGKRAFDLPERAHVQTAPSQALWDELKRRGEVMPG